MQNMKLGPPMTADGGSSPMVKPKGDKQVEYLDLDLDSGKSTPPRKVGICFTSSHTMSDTQYTIMANRFEGISRLTCVCFPSSDEKQWNWHGSIRWACWLCGCGPATDAGPQEHPGSLERWPSIHRDRHTIQRTQVTMLSQPPSLHTPQTTGPFTLLYYRLWFVLWDGPAVMFHLNDILSL